MSAQAKESPILRLSGLTKDYGQGEVLHGIDLDVYPGEFLTLLGPSGCGKTTTLRLIAGLERPGGGSVYLENQDVTALPPEERSVNTVFQNYALFPHMNVFQNIAYGLKLRHVPKQEQKERVREMLSLVRLEGYERRMPTQLSGGQRQRVAIARALVLRPKILLLDEPLGALDLKLRQQMQQELKRLQQQLNITFLYITHDQEEALNMSTRVVIMREGHIEQIGTPEEVYERPETVFAASFIGQSNLLRGKVEALGENGHLSLQVAGTSIPALSDGRFPVSPGDDLVLCLRPQRVLYGYNSQFDMCLQGRILSKEYAGGMQHTRIALSDKLTLSAVSQAAELDKYPIGETICVGWDVRHAPLVPDDPSAPALEEGE
ncbi:MAG: ABC transporter ATP-binding protein [Candidatus Limiplasma sp.]|nr:ABC transporter ATP-binding protein [Candidatus Limiplasma sp.]